MKQSSNSHAFRIPWFSRLLLTLVIMSALVGIQPVQAQGNHAPPPTWYVSTSGSDTYDCSTITSPCSTINGAIGKAADGDMIKVAIGTYTDSGDSVVLLNKSITLSGGWGAMFAIQSGISTIDGQDMRSGVIVPSASTATIDTFEIRNTRPNGQGGAGIHNQGNLTVTNCVFRNNTGDGDHDSGGISTENGSLLTVNNTTFEYNTSVSSASAIGIYDSTAVITNTTINNNLYYEDVLLKSMAGSIWVEGQSAHLTLNSSTVSGNQSNGIILHSGSSAEINNSTISGNYGKGITADGAALISININNSTIVRNWAGLDLYQLPSGNVNVKNSILADNLDPEYPFDCVGTFTSLGHNLIGAKHSLCNVTPATGDLFGTPEKPIDPRISELGNYGGPTRTRKLLAGSLALSGGADCLATDQRGIARPVGSACDIGAYESETTLVRSITRANPSPTSAATLDFTVVFSDAVTGVDAGDFSLTTGLDAQVTGATGSGNTYTVSVSTGAGNMNGVILLGVYDNDSIIDSSGNPLGGTGTKGL